VSDAFVQRLSTVVVVVCLVVLAGTTALVVSPAMRQWMGVGPGAQPPAYAVGDLVDISADVYRASPVSLVLFARSTCPACQRSADFHKQVVAAGRTSGIPSVLMTPSEDVAAERIYAEGLGIAATDVHMVPTGSIKLQSVPALMVVDSAGLIRHVWFGAPDAAAQAAILAAVTAVADARLR
jgi:hypothetical protein